MPKDIPDLPTVDASEKRRAKRVLDKLEAAYPDAGCALHFNSAWELVVATILSAQCTDERVNQVTPKLFKAFPTPDVTAKATPVKIEPYVKSCGFFRNKAKSIHGAAVTVMDDHGGEVPGTMPQLLTLPGVARKTANVVLGDAFGKNFGIAVDTHVQRLSQRLGLSEHTDPKKIELDLMARVPRKRWTMTAHLLIAHGRRCCKARKPQCESCPLQPRMCCNLCD
jgi:endonuclease-3